MGDTLFYAAKNLNAEEVKRGIDYVKRNFDPTLFRIEALSEFQIVLNPQEEPDVPVECFTFPPTEKRESDYSTDFTKTNQVQPHDQHLKTLLSGLEELLRGKFAATDCYGWSAGTYQLRKELKLEI